MLKTELEEYHFRLQLVRKTTRQHNIPDWLVACDDSILLIIGELEVFQWKTHMK